MLQKKSYSPIVPPNGDLPALQASSGLYNRIVFHFLDTFLPTPFSLFLTKQKMLLELQGSQRVFGSNGADVLN